MIPVSRLLYKIDQRLNKLASLEHQSIPLEDKILVLREAQLALLKKKREKKDYEDLQNLVEAPEKHKLSLQETDKTLHRWTAPLPTDPKFFAYIDAYLLCDKGECKSTVVWVNNDLPAHASITTLLQNSNYKPSFEYQETFCDLSDNEIGIYTDGSFTPRILHLSYLRYPAELDAAGYEDFDGAPSTDVDCELSERLEDELLDLAVTALALYTENNPAYQGNNPKVNP